MPDYFASAEKFISRLPSKFMYSYVVLVVSGYWTRILGNVGALQKY